MENFTVYNPVKIVFGKNVAQQLGKAVSEYGKNILLIYGSGSIKQNGIYDTVKKQLSSVGARVTEYSGIKPNPVVTDVRKATESGRKANAEVVLAVGGGSVLDSAKITALSIPENLDGWKIMKGRAKPAAALPLITVLTLAATGSEMNPYAVLQNNETQEKIGFGHHLAFPKYSFLDPEYTFSVSREYTAYGIVDLIAHAMEGYFGHGECSLTDRFTASIVLDAMHWAPLLLSDPDNYEYRANIMWA
ncbi:MAG: iron-containing alcohol dehydrogenase, partial [Bacteroidetes bacterium]|nr:iron-containing alcohol dehydrogenase [Bacteroidota bacterium]